MSRSRPVWLHDGYAMVVGLEIHAQIASQAKLFSDARTEFGAAPNSQVSPVDAGMPGMLPVLNVSCVEQAIRAGLGLNASINRFSRFDRKNYFYPDLPQGYQISQFHHPIVGAGRITVEDQDTQFEVGIERAHLEQDAGKSIHDLDPKRGYVDLNRSGVALIEIVSMPDMRSPQDAVACVRTVREILMALGVCNGDMEKGQLRADVNVSVRPADSDRLGTRCEIKNLNSFRFIRQATHIEGKRQCALLNAGKSIIQETRLFDTTTGRTRPMRSKEDAHDYRYFPDPDLPPIVLDDQWINRIAACLPELPAARRERFVTQYGLSDYDARVLAANGAVARYFETVAASGHHKRAANWITQDLFGWLNDNDLDIDHSPVSPAQLASLVGLVGEGSISGKVAKDVFARMTSNPGLNPEQVVADEGLTQIDDADAIDALVDQILTAHPDVVAKVRKQQAQGHTRPKALGFLVGKVMARSAGKADPNQVNRSLQNRLGLD